MFNREAERTCRPTGTVAIDGDCSFKTTSLELKFKSGRVVASTDATAFSDTGSGREKPRWHTV